MLTPALEHLEPLSNISNKEIDHDSDPTGYKPLQNNVIISLPTLGDQSELLAGAGHVAINRDKFTKNVFGFSSTQNQLVKTRSGRIVKPVQRLIDEMEVTH